MRVIVQRSRSSNVTIDGTQVGQIDYGLVLLVGFTKGDSIKEIEYLAKKIMNLRIFDDDNGVMNRSLLDVGGSILSISQFTLYANTAKGNRPSYVDALGSTEASPLYDLFNEKLREYGIAVKTGIFGADMVVNINNDGPVTILLESGDSNAKE
ncbi:MAG: D-tyrosyl-tRNA(Tyr) deacylase [Firmicutes bacterium]|nr:D-tyrosyl-tRNA(Tyr) deacylase [Bacillota bacterium]